MRTLQKNPSGYHRILPLLLATGLIFSYSVTAVETSLISTGSVWRYFDLGTDPGPGWQTLAFDDSAWLTGPGEFGFGDGDEATILNRVNTAYFRATFIVTDPSLVTSLFADVWRDDGVIVYINGVEVFRDNMDAGPVGYSTSASTTALDDGEDPVRGNIIPAVLAAGVNIIAVEVHQSPFSTTDLSFDLALVADALNPNQPPTANNQSVVAVQGAPTPVVLSGSDPEGNPLTYTITSLPAHGTLTGLPPNVLYTSASDYLGADSFTFKVNDGALDSADATVRIQVLALPDPPELVSAIAECNTASVAVAFNEPVDVSTAADIRDFFIADSLGNPVPVLSAALRDEQTVTLSLATPLNPALSYILQVSSVCDLVGDCVQQQIVPIELHGEPLTLACDVALEFLWPPNSTLLNVGFSAISSGTITSLKVFSNEPDSGGDAQFANGILLVRAQREGKLEGRVYLIVVTSTDACGNSAVCCTTVVAPHDSSQAAFDSIIAEAHAARAQCSPNGSPITPYPILR